MAVKAKKEAQQPLTLRAHRLMEAFAKSDDERDFYLDRVEGFIIYVDLDKSQAELDALEKELAKDPERYCLIPKLTFYETKKIMEGFVNEKVYDIDTKEKLLDIIQSKEARYNFLEFIYDHHTEFEKWQQYYQERSRIRIIEWLRNHHFHFVFEEDLEMVRHLLEKLKQSLFDSKVGKDILNARKVLISKAKTYYSNEALNPRPKRGRPPKQTVKQEVEQQLTTDIYLTVPESVRPFLFTPEISSASAVTFSADFGSQEGRKSAGFGTSDTSLENIQQKLASLRSLSSRWLNESGKEESATPSAKKKSASIEDEEEEEEEEELELESETSPRKPVRLSPQKQKKPAQIKPAAKKDANSALKPKSAAKGNSKGTRRILPRVIKTSNKNTKTLNGRSQKPKRIIPVQRIQAKAKSSSKVQSKAKAPKKPTISSSRLVKGKRRLRAARG